VLLAAGNYGSQTLDGRSRGSAAVVFTPQDQAVLFDDLSVHGGSDFVLRRISVRGEILIENQHPESEGSSNITLDHTAASTLRLVGRIQNIKVRGGSYGNTTNSQPQIKKYNPGDPDTSAPTNITIDGAAFHDFRRSDSTVHTECLQILNGNHITIRNSRFWNCDGTGDLGITPNSLITDLTIENNFIGGGGDTGYGIQIGMLLRNFVFRYNSSSQPIFFADSESGGPYTFTGNYMPYNRSLCRPGATYSNNMLAGGKCGSSDVAVRGLQFVDSANHDLHLAPHAAALGAGGIATAPTTDIDGDGRPALLPRDAGADQQESALLNPRGSIGEVALGMSESSLAAAYTRGRVKYVHLGSARVKQLTYRLHGARLTAYVDNGAVVAIATTSRYYTTPGGFGPGADATTAPVRLRWNDCLQAYVGSAGRLTSVRVRTADRTRAGKITEVYVLRARFAVCRKP
jgi:hypothetical protein